MADRFHLIMLIPWILDNVTIKVLWDVAGERNKCKFIFIFNGPVFSKCNAYIVKIVVAFY